MDIRNSGSAGEPKSDRSRKPVFAGMINWYRALRTSGKPIGNPTIELPVKILWGAQDRFLASEMAELSLVYCPKGQLTLLPEASHWLQHEEPAAVSHALNEFFAMRDLSD